MSNELENIVLKVFKGGSFCNDCSHLRFRYIRSGSGGEDLPECKVLDGVSHLDECPGIDDQIEQQVSSLQAENKELSRHRVTLFKLLDSKAVVTHSDIRACFTVDGDGLHFDPDLAPIIPPGDKG